MKIIYGNTYEIAKSYAWFVINNLRFKQKFDFDDDYEQILSSINQISLLDSGNENNYLIDHATFLTNKTKKATEFIKDLLNSNDEIICIHVARSKDSFNPLLITNKNVEFIKATKLNDKDKFKLVNDLLKTYPINFDCETTKINFVNALANDPYLIINEVQKASNYSLNNDFNEQTINSLVAQNTNNTIYDLVNFILLNKKQEALKLFDSLLKKKIQPITCIQVMGMQLFDLKLQKIYLEINNNNVYNAQKVLGISQYKIMTNLKILKNTTLPKIKKLLNSLILLEYNIKNNLVIGDIGIKMLIMEN